MTSIAEGVTPMSYEDVTDPVVGQIAKVTTFGLDKLLVFDGKRWWPASTDFVVINGVDVPCPDVVDLYICKENTIPSADKAVTMMLVEFIAFHSDPGQMFSYRLSNSESPERMVCVAGEETHYITFPLN